MNTIIECLLIPFRKEAKPAPQRARNTNGMYARYVKVTHFGSETEGFYMPSIKGFRASGKGVIRK